MRLISLEVLIRALQEQGLDNVYLVLEQVFYEESLIVVDKEGKALRAFFEPEEIYDYLEDLLNILNLNNKEEEL